MRIGPDGKEVGPEGYAVKTRKQEVEAERLRQNNAKEHQLQSIAESIVSAGPGNFRQYANKLCDIDITGKVHVLITPCIDLCRFRVSPSNCEGWSLKTA